MDPTGKLHIQSLLDRFQEVHHQVLGDVIPAECEGILVVLPGALDQLRLEPFISEEALITGNKQRQIVAVHLKEPKTPYVIHKGIAPPPEKDKDKDKDGNDKGDGDDEPLTPNPSPAEGRGELSQALGLPRVVSAGGAGGWSCGRWIGRFLAD